MDLAFACYEGLRDLEVDDSICSIFSTASYDETLRNAGLGRRLLPIYANLQRAKVVSKKAINPIVLLQESKVLSKNTRTFEPPGTPGKNSEAQIPLVEC